MVRCNKQAWIEPAFDGELDPISRLRLRAHRARCPACATEFRRLSRLRGLVRQLRYRHPRASAVPRRALGWPGAVWDGWVGQWLGLGASVALAACLAFTIVLHDEDGALRREVIAGHERLLRTGPHIDRSLAPRLADTIGVNLPAIDLSADGFPLVDTRIDRIAGHPAAVFVYRANQHVINLFVWGAPIDAAPTPGTWSAEGFSVCHWRNRHVAFFAVSDLSAETLEEFERLYKARRRDLPRGSQPDSLG